MPRAPKLCAHPGCTSTTPCADHPHQPTSRGPHGMRSTWRNRTQQRRFRTAVLQRAGHHCQHPGCHVHGDQHLQAHHTQPGNDDPRTGLALCFTHHRLIDPYARPTPGG